MRKELYEQDSQNFYKTSGSRLSAIDKELNFQTSYNSILEFIQIHLYPNPSSNWLRIETLPGNQIKSVFLVNRYGHEVFSSLDINVSDFDMQVKFYDDGEYLLRVFTLNGLVAKRVIIKK